MGFPDRRATYQEQVDHLYRLCSLSIAATLVNSFLLIFILRKVISHTASINWIAAMLLISLFQYVLQQKYEDAGIIKDGENKWGTLFNIGAALSGLFWGSSAIFLFPAASVILQLLLALVTCAMLAMSVGVYSANMNAFMAYSIPAAFPIIIRCLIIRDEVHLTVGGVILIFLILMYLTARGVNSALTRSFIFRQAHARSISRIREKQGAAHEPYTRLKKKSGRGGEVEGKRKRAQWMKGFDPYKLRLRENNKLEAKRQVPTMVSPRQGKSSNRDFLLKKIILDFSNLFTYLQGKVSLVLLDMDSGQSGYDKLKDIEKSIQKGALLTKQLTKLGTRLNHGKRKVDLNILLRRNAQKFRREKGQITFHLRGQDRIWDIKMDQREVDRVIRGIYDDSYHSMLRGGDLYVRTQNVNLGETFLSPYGLKPGKFVKVSVTYTGSHRKEMDPEVLQANSNWIRELIRENGGILNTYKDEGNENTLDLYFPAY